MKTGVWTIFHRSGRYTDDYTPVWQKYICYGGREESVQQADGGGNSQNRLTLRLSDYETRLLDQDGRILSYEEAQIAPGDLVTAGEAVSSEGVLCWRIGSVARENSSGRLGGIVIAAE